jgi:hypothetical protein
MRDGCGSQLLLCESVIDSTDVFSVGLVSIRRVRTIICMFDTAPKVVEMSDIPAGPA